MLPWVIRSKLFLFDVVTCENDAMLWLQEVFLAHVLGVLNITFIVRDDVFFLLQMYLPCVAMN